MTTKGQKPKAVVLLSGGMDSATVVALAQEAGFEVVALTVDYGQRHAVELAAARRVAQTLGVRDHRVIEVDLRAIGGSALTAEIAVPLGRDEASIGEGVPVTYVPARNTILLSLALGLAEVLDCRDLFVGVNALDSSGYPDCRPAFVRAFEALAQVATTLAETGGPVRIHAPLLHLTKAQIASEAARLGLDLGITHTCYAPSAEGLACGLCDACQLRARGFAQAGLPDPTHYAPRTQDASAPEHR